MKNLQKILIMDVFHLSKAELNEITLKRFECRDLSDFPILTVVIVGLEH